MREEIKALQNERNQIHKDIYNNIIPKRMPVSLAISRRMLAEYAGQDVVDVQYKFDTLTDVALEVGKRLYSDTLITGGVASIGRPPAYYSLLGSKSFVMGQSGFVQHPEVSGMNEDEYPELIKDPYAFLLEKVFPRLYKSINLQEPLKMLLDFQRAKLSLEDEGKRGMSLPMSLMEEFGYYNGAPAGCTTMSIAPCDFLADQLRSFSGLSLDIRRHREEVKEACEAVLPLLFYWSLPKNPDPQGFVNTPLHMPTYMREKDFAEVWFPSYLKMYRMYAALGIRGACFCEHDWMRYLDYLQELPAGFVLTFEYGDPKTIKDKVGKKHIIKGLYPINLVKTGTKQQVIDKAKELLDIMLPGGGYIFAFDKSPLSLRDINFENLCALSEFLRDYAVYPDAGEPYGGKINEEGYVFNVNEIPPIQSKYLLNWDLFKKQYPYTPDYQKAVFESYDKQMFDHIMWLMV
ncbi:hypothetical protein OXPF_19940 [Oxobacter pfennigii]|uniref:Uroporphyrinogen decarboxylase (URO-D) n=1 Tax=Oxobacter pfennigii TaxID=36849 RepID=A0A0P8W740_9CLOT|nr:hypothetical protein [Oxobacter pfennigii]KPU44500.1 hypothetical protein OXPF_19940 [Oxobacter pfennigii]